MPLGLQDEPGIGGGKDNIDLVTSTAASHVRLRVDSPAAQHLGDEGLQTSTPLLRCHPMSNAEYPVFGDQPTETLGPRKAHSVPSLPRGCGQAVEYRRT
jgi:hypothetical protein